jgi:protein-S-isoprenylcysteine O-methyltransferase Ste14
MALQSELERQGSWLFRRRGWLPLAFLPVVVAVAYDLHWQVGNVRFHQIWEWLCLALSFVGLAVRVLTVGYAPAGTSGRNTANQVAWSLNTTGMYSVVRHPLYFGNYLIGLGVVCVPLVWWLPLLYTAAFWLYYERIMIAEEAYLQQQFGAEFESWADATPAFVPRVKQWRPPAEHFSLRFVLRKEYTGLAVVILLHGALQLVEHEAINHRLQLEPAWEVVIAGGGATYVLLRALKKHTRILHVPDRQGDFETEPAARS